MAHSLDDLDAELVAYLDGEVDSETARRMEERISHDAQAESRLRALERAWDALDELPHARASELFASATVEMLALSEICQAEAEEASATSRYRMRFVTSLLVCAAVASVGYALGTNLLNRNNEQLLRNLPVIENLDQLRQIDALDDLRHLQSEKVFLPDTPAEKKE